jgi:SAM-dependent methyltransferase
MVFDHPRDETRPSLIAMESDRERPAGTLSTGRREAQRQWEANPCGADTVESGASESLDWFREARRVRYEDYAPWLIRATGIREIRGKKVLEIGVGLGSDHYTLAKGGNEMTALDLSREHLRLTTKHLQLEGLQTTTVHGDMENMPFADATFDVVYSFGVLHHTDNMDKAVSEIRRVLRPGGQAVISVYHRDSLYFWVGLMAINGVLRGWLFRYGWKRTLARIEAGAGDDYVPTVHVLTGSRLRRLFHLFDAGKIEVNHAGLPGSVTARMGPRFRAFTERLWAWAGWYLTIHATKRS